MEHSTRGRIRFQRHNPASKRPAASLPAHNRPQALPLPVRSKRKDPAIDVLDSRPAHQKRQEDHRRVP